MDTDRIYAESIANEYSKKTTRKVVALKKLDQHIKRPVKTFGYTFGTFMAVMTGTGAFLFPHRIGIVLSIVGFMGISANYPINMNFMKHRKEKYAYDILILSEDICDVSE